MAEVLVEEKKGMGTKTEIEKVIEEIRKKDTGLTRIGVSLYRNLLNKFDGIIRGRGYSSRSEGIRDAIRAYIKDYEWMEQESGTKIGTITYIYETGQIGLRAKLEKIECAFRNTIKTSYSVYLDNDDCFALVVIKDKAKRIKELAERIMSQNGVKHVKLTTTHEGI